MSDTSTPAVQMFGAHAELTVQDGVARIRLVEAKSMNILGSSMVGDLTAAFHAVAGRSDVRAVVLRGTGDTSFMGGADIFEMAELDRSTGEAFIRALKNLCDAIVATPQPVIARLSGWCLGGGLEVAAACDVRIASTSAQFGMPEVAVGIPSVIYAALLPELIGESRAAYFLLACENIDAATAEQWGFVHEVIPDDDLDMRITSLSSKLAGFGPAVLSQQKRLLRKWRTMTVDGAIEDSVAEFGRAFETGEPQRFMGDFIAHKRAERSA